MSDDQKQDITPQQESPQSSEAPTVEPPIQSSDSSSIAMPPEPPEASRDASTPIPVEDQVPKPSSVPTPAPQNVATTQTQSLAQQDERGFIKSLLAKAQDKIQFNKQKKLEKITQLAQKKKTITNDDVQKLLRVSDATATRYLVKLVQQSRLTRVGSPRDAKYQFLR